LIPVVQEPPSGMLSQTGSLNLTGSPISASAIPADAVGMSVMNQLWKLMAPALGPAAKFVLKQQLKEMGLSAQAVGRAQYADLITLLAPKIPNVMHRNAFIESARSLVRR